MSNINDAPMVIVLLSYIYGMGLGVRTDIRTDGRTDSQVTTKTFEIDGLPNFLRYGAPLARLRRAGAPLKINLTKNNLTKIMEPKIAKHR